MKISEELAKLTADKLTAEAALAVAEANHKAALEAITAERDTAAARVTALEAEALAAQLALATANGEITTLKANAKTVAELASRQALDIAAGQGIPPVAGAGSAETPTEPAALWEEYAQAKTPGARMDAWAKLKAAKLIN